MCQHALESAKLGDIIAGAIRAVIEGADNRGDIETFGNAKIDRFKTFLELPNGIPSHGAFGRVFPLIDARRFQGIFIEWTKRVWKAAQGQVAAIPPGAPPTSCTVTIDAMDCRKKVARQVVKQDADCVLAVKKNQPRL